MQIQSKHAAILRNAIARMIRQCPNTPLETMGLKALYEYSIAVSAYCTHPDQTFVQRIEMVQCLDCGLITEKRQALSLVPRIEIDDEPKAPNTGE